MRWQRKLRRKMVTKQSLITIPWLLTIDKLAPLTKTSTDVIFNASWWIRELISSFILLPSISVMKTVEKTV